MPSNPVSKARFWTGWVLTALSGLLLLSTGAMSAIKPEAVAAGVVHLGYPASLVSTIGIIELCCAVLYLIPQTSFLGASLVTVYLGGATASHVRIGEPFFMVALVGVVVWVGLFLRDDRLREFLPFFSWRENA